MKWRLTKLFLLSCSLLILVLPNTFLSSCKNNRKLTLANFESYMSNSLKQYLNKKYDIDFAYYTTNENILAKFTDYYDMAIPSCYEVIELLNKGLIKKILWDKFNLKNIKNSIDAKQLFIDGLIDNINEILSPYVINDDIKKNFNILDYCVPYFMQSLMFAYKGDELSTFYDPNGNEIDKNNVTWQDIFYTISPSNKYLDRRFIPQSVKKIGMLDDARSIHDVCRIVETNDNSNVPNPNATKIDIDKTFSSVNSYFKQKSQNSWINLNTDSGIIARNLADPNGYNSAITWSGDILYTAFSGADEYASYNAHNFHIQKATGGATLNELDVIVINQKIADGSKNEQKIYDLIKDFCLTGYDDYNNICDFDNSTNMYKYWITENFNAVGYTPILKSLYLSLTDVNCKYWENESKPFDLETKKMYISIISYEPANKFLIGTPLSNILNSNLHWSWLEQKQLF